jgi:hypothetical protein
MAALVGATIGGLFTAWGQARQFRAQSEFQRDQSESSNAAALAQWTREQDASDRAESLDVARELFEKFTELHRAVQRDKPTFSEILQETGWGPKWETIWNPEVSLDIDVRARLISDERTRQTVQRLVELLDSVDSLTSDSGYPTAVIVRLQHAAGQLTAEGIEVMGAYIRHQPHESERGVMLESLEKARERFDSWHESMAEEGIARSEAEAEKML